MFCVPEHGTTLSEEEAELLEGEITEAELHRAVASMKDGSSPGMDGIPIELGQEQSAGRSRMN